MRNFLKNIEGATAIEFAVVGPALFLMLSGIIELGLIMFANSAMEGATNIGARIGTTGFTTGGMSRENYIKNEIVSHTGGLLKPSDISISILSYSSFSSVGKPEPCIAPPTAPCGGVAGVNFVDINGNSTWDQDQGRSTAGGAGSIVLYRATYPWHLFTPIMSSYLGTGGIYTITAVSAVRNEQFQ